MQTLKEMLQVVLEWKKDVEESVYDLIINEAKAREIVKKDTN